MTERARVVDGVFAGQVDGREVSVRVRLVVTTDESVWQVEPMGEPQPAQVSGSPAVRRLALHVADTLAAMAVADRPILTGSCAGPPAG